MTRVPTLTDPRGTRPPRVAVPSSQLTAPPLGNVRFGPVPPSSGAIIGQAIQGFAGDLSDIGRTLQEHGLRLRQAEQARQITERQTTSIGVIATGEDQAKQAGIGNAETVFEASLEPFQTEISAIENTFVRETVQLNFDRDRAKALVRVRRIETGRELSAGAAADDQLDDQLTVSLSKGDTPLAEVIARFRDSVQSKVGGVYDEDGAERRIEAFELRAATTEYRRLLAINPDLAAEFLDSDFIRSTLSADDIAGRKQEIKRQLGTNLQAELDSIVTTVNSELDRILLQEPEHFTTEEFGLLIDATAKRIAEITKGAPFDKQISEADARIVLLGRHLRLAAEEGDEGRFLAVSAELPNTAEGRLLRQQAEDILKRKLSQIDRTAEINAEVQSAIRLRYALSSKSAAHRAAVDRDAAAYFADRIAANPELTATQVKRELVARYGPLGLLPDSIKRPAESIVRNPENATTEQIIETMELLDFVRTAAPFAFRDFGDDVRAQVKLYQTMIVPGQDAKEVAKLVNESLNPPNLARAEEIRQRETEFNRFAETELVRLIDDEFEIDLSAERDFIDVLRGDEDVPALRPGALGDVIPFAVVAQFREGVLNGLRKGQTKEAAVALAWETLTRTVGVTRIFSEVGRIRALAPETMYGSASYGSEEMETDFANAMSIDFLEDELLLPPIAAQQAPLEKSLLFPKPEILKFDEQGQLATLKALSRHGLSHFIEYARERIELVPHPTKSLATESGNLPLYQPMFVDDDGALHPIMRVTTDEDGKEVVEPYLIAPDERNGMTGRARSREVIADANQSVEARARADKARAERQVILDRNAELLRKDPKFIERARRIRARMDKRIKKVQERGGG